MRLAPLATLFLASCASIVARPTAVHVTSEPPGVPFKTNYGLRGVTPETIVPPNQAKNLLVHFEDGQGRRVATKVVGHRQSWWAWGNCVLGPIGLVGILIDAGSDSAQVLKRDSVHVVIPAIR